MKTVCYNIRDFCTIKSGKRLPAGFDFSDEPTPFKYIRARDIKSGKITLDDVAFIDAETQRRVSRYIINQGDIAITIVANIGDVGYATEDCDGINLTENAVRLTNFDENVVCSKYLAYYLGQPSMKTYMENLAAGAAQAKLGIYKIEKMKVQLPEVPIQRAVVETIEQYDNLIEINNKRIKLLEQMAENLYKEWFVRFRFPGHEKTEYIDSKIGRVPSTFIVTKMQDVFEYYIGGGWGNDDANDDYSIPAYVIRGTDFPHVSKGDITSCPLRWHKQSNYTSRALKENDVILEVSGGTAEQPVGRTLLVTKDIIERFDGQVICASFCKQIRVKKTVSPVYFFYWMQFLYETRIIDRFQLQSTGIINFQFEFFLKKCDIMLPSNEVMTAFDSKVKEINNEIALIARRNENLKRQRDYLLPRLMSGKLEIV